MSSKPTVLITGASRGLGAEAAVATAQLGANLILTARSESGLQHTADRIAALKQEIEVSLYTGDLCDNTFCTELAQKISQGGKLDAVILNAAQVEPIGAVSDIDEDQWSRCLELNLTAPFRLIKRLLPPLRSSRGRLITIGTGAATQPIPSWSGYCVSKAGLLMLTRVLAAEAPEIVSFSFVPGVIDTGMQQSIRDHKDLMPEQLAGYFASLHSSGQLEPPEVPGRALAWCALNAPGDWSGQEIVYSDPNLVEQVRKAFVDGPNRE